MRMPMAWMSMCVAQVSDGTLSPGPGCPLCVLLMRICESVFWGELGMWVFVGLPVNQDSWL